MPVYGAICLDSFENVLLVKGRRSQKWSFPKGHAKIGELPIDCAKRELFEEAGIRVTSPQNGYYVMKGGEYFIFHINKLCFLKIQDNVEINDVAWWPLNALPTVTNIDVSIFRSHLQMMPNVSYRDFIYSTESNTRIQTILRRLT